jgi:hypothetical protein
MTVFNIFLMVFSFRTLYILVNNKVLSSIGGEIDRKGVQATGFRRQVLQYRLYVYGSGGAMEDGRWKQKDIAE